MYSSISRVCAVGVELLPDDLAGQLDSDLATWVRSSWNTRSRSARISSCARATMFWDSCSARPAIHAELLGRQPRPSMMRFASSAAFASCALY